MYGAIVGEVLKNSENMLEVNETLEKMSLFYNTEALTSAPRL